MRIELSCCCGATGLYEGRDDIVVRYGSCEWLRDHAKCPALFSLTTLVDYPLPTGCETTAVNED